MNVADVNTVIENLCQKIGTVKEELFPEIVRMCIGRYTVNTLMTFIILIVMILIVRHGVIVQHDKSRSYDAQENWAFASFGCGIIAMAFLIAFWCNLYELIQWAIAPTAKVFEYILTLL